MKFLKNKKLYFLLVFLIISGFLIYRNFLSGQAAKTIASAKVVRGNLEATLSISGAIDAEEKVTLQFPTGGRLTWVGVKEGDTVRKYQSIASIDQRQLQKTLSKYLNTYMKSRWDFDQATKDTYKDQVITDTLRRIIDKTQFDLNNSVSDVEIQSISLELANLWTPIEGVVTRVTMPIAGENIYLPTDAKFDIVNPKTVFFSAKADQTEVIKLKEGLPGELILDAYPEAKIPGKIKTISFIPASGETGTVYEIKFLFDNDNSLYKYRIGMAGDLSFVTNRRENALSVPGKFVKEEDGKKYAKTMRAGKSEKIYIETGLETDSDTEIKNGLNEGDVVYE